MNSVRTDLHSYHEEHKYEFDGAQFILNNMLLDFKNKLFMIWKEILQDAKYLPKHNFRNFSRYLIGLIR